VSTGQSRKRRWWLGAILAGISAIAILSLLACFFQDMREGQQWLECHKNLKLIGLALQNYQRQYGSLPPAYLSDKAGRPMLSWRVLILPDLGRDDLYRQIRFDEPWDGPSNLRLARQSPDVYHCPAHTSAKVGETSYLAVVGAGTAWTGSQGRPLTTPTRELGTVLVAEAGGHGISWMEPRDLTFADAAAGVTRGEEKAGLVARHFCGGGEEPIEGVYSGYRPWAVGYRLRGANCLFTSGFVYTVAETVPPATLLELLTAETAQR
jgi:hypothetical protein